MAHKKIDDVKKPENVTPAASSRPIIVNNRPVLTDPMMVPEAEEKSEGVSVEVARTAKTITPVSADVAQEAKKPEDEPAKTEQAAPVEADAAPEASPLPADGKPADKPSETKTPITNHLPDSEESGAPRDADAASEAAAAKAEAAKQAREAELEQMIATNKYAVPINAVERKRTTRNSVLLVLLMVLLAILLLDLMLDANIIELLQKLPHTHFFTAA